MGFFRSMLTPASSIRQTRVPLKLIILNNIEFSPGYTISEWCRACDRLQPQNTGAPKDLVSAHRHITERIVADTLWIAERFANNPDAQIDEATRENLAGAILTCSVLTEQLRVHVGEGWPLTPGLGSNGNFDSADNMINQVRTEVKRFKAQVRAQGIQTR